MEEWAEERLVKIIEGNKAKNIYNTDVTKFWPNEALSLKEDPCDGRKNSDINIWTWMLCFPQNYSNILQACEQGRKKWVFKTLLLQAACENQYFCDLSQVA